LGKALSVNAYQRAYRDLHSEEKFNASMRNKFNPELLEIEPYESTALAFSKKQ